MKDGYIKVAAASIDMHLANCQANHDEILQAIQHAYQQETKVLVFSELVLTGYSCQDLFFQKTLRSAAKNQLIALLKETQDMDMVIILGLPLEVRHKLYNCAAVLYRGEILAFVPKTYLPNYHEFYEARFFETAPEENENILFNGQWVPFGKNLLLTNIQDENMCIGIEICEDLWVPNPPSTKLALNGATILVNCSASNELTTKKDYRHLLVSSQSARLNAAYILANAGAGESTSDVVFSGHHLIYENGTLLNESKGFEPEIIYSEIDVAKLQQERLQTNTFKNACDMDVIYFDMPLTPTTLTRHYSPYPFVPANELLREKRCKEIFEIQTQALVTRLKASHSTKAVIGISGGLDSTLALLVTVMAFDVLKLPRENIIAITMPCFGTTKRTKNNALGLMKELKVTSRTISIEKAVLQHFKDIQHNVDIHDVTYENAQARERTQILMDIANQENGLVIGTGDLSEMALGWCTYNGDHMSMYAINCSIPKTLVRYLVAYCASLYQHQKLEKYLLDILDTPVSPELLPSDQDTIVQKTEDIVGPYVLHDFFLYHMMRSFMTPKKLYRVACYTFENEFDHETIKKWLITFYRRFFNQQFKRNCVPDGPKVGSVALSPRGDWRMPSDAESSLWLKELEDIS